MTDSTGTMDSMLHIYRARFDREHDVHSIVESLGGADVTQIFVHNLTSLPYWRQIATVLPGYDKYDQRALVFARPHDIVCVEVEVDNRYLTYLEQLEIGPASGNVIMGSEVAAPGSNPIFLDAMIHNHEVLLKIKDMVGPNDEIVLNPFMGSQKQFELGSKLEMITGKKVHVCGGNPAIVDAVDAKHNAKKKSIQLDVPVCEGDLVEIETGDDGRPLDVRPIQTAIDRHLYKTGRVIVRGSRGSSGSSTFIVENRKDSIQKALHEINRRTDNTVYLVEVMLDVIVSTNVMLHVGPGGDSIVCVGITDQRLSDQLVHEGNLYPSKARTVREMLGSAEKIAKWLQGEGYRGLLGLDFGEYLNPATGEPHHFLSEINPRMNGAAYPKAMMEYLNEKQKKRGGPYVESFLSASRRTDAASFADLQTRYGSLFYSPQTGRGLVPYNTGILQDGKFALALFGQSRDEVLEMYEEVKSVESK